MIRMNWKCDFCGKDLGENAKAPFICTKCKKRRMKGKKVPNDWYG